MKLLTQTVDVLYIPTHALVLYKGTKRNDTYVESYEIDEEGRPVNAHPLTEKEAEKISRSLGGKDRKEKQIGLFSEGILPDNLLYMRSGSDSCAIWYTPPALQPVYFTSNLGIEDGNAHVPALIWKANRLNLTVFALRNSKRPTLETPLYSAPFFNTNYFGSVCMGNVQRKFPASLSVQSFIAQWEEMFWNSRFSHVTGANPVHGNIVQLWQNQIQSGQPFPTKVLKKTKSTVKSLFQ